MPVVVQAVSSAETARVSAASQDPASRADARFFCINDSQNFAVPI
jgi:hypothetical protein